MPKPKRTKNLRNEFTKEFQRAVRRDKKLKVTDISIGFNSNPLPGIELLAHCTPGNSTLALGANE